MNKFTVICSAIVVIILVLLAFETYNNQSQFEGFIVVERGYIDNDIEQIIMYDPDTLVMYSYLKTIIIFSF